MSSSVIEDTKNIPLNLLTFKACCKTVFLLGFAEDRGWVKTNQRLFIFYRRDVLIEKSMYLLNVLKHILYLCPKIHKLSTQ